MIRLSLLIVVCCLSWGVVFVVCRLLFVAARWSLRVVRCLLFVVCYLLWFVVLWLLLLIVVCCLLSGGGSCLLCVVCGFGVC